MSHDVPDPHRARLEALAEWARRGVPSIDLASAVEKRAESADARASSVVIW